jgi:hypothetical protein
MTTDNGTANPVLVNLSTRSTPNNDSPNALENGLASTTTATPNENNETTWVNTFLEFDRVLSGSLLHLCYRIIDIIILLIGLSSRSNSCTLSNRLVVTSICLLIFYFIDLTLIIFYFIRNVSESHIRLSEEEKAEHLRRVSGIRGFFIFFKLIPVCFGTSYALTLHVSQADDCELIRFCLGIVCVSTLLIMIMPPTKPEIPTRRSFVIECFILLFLLIINGIYFGTVASSMKNIEHPTCIYNKSEDLYLGAPLKSYARVGLILFGCTTAIHIINLLVTQLCHRLTNGRHLFTYYYGVQYLLTYSGSLLVIYYFSVGALFLFQPRSGQPCRTNAPGLYQTLLIWQWIRILSPLIAVPLILILCCLGVLFGIVLSYCLPASITVPLLEALRVR